MESSHISRIIVWNFCSPRVADCDTRNITDVFERLQDFTQWTEMLQAVTVFFTIHNEGNDSNLQRT
jgi:hypothetical protein